MTILEDYLKKINVDKWGYIEFETELKSLISRYNKNRKTNLILYVSSFNPVLPCALEQKDFYFLKDLLDSFEKGSDIDFYIETPGGNGVTAEEIVRYIRSEFNKISFVICGEAKSAGTILAMAGDEILMTKTGSLGPIDAQMPSNRGMISAYDYIDWMNQKRKEAEKEGKLNPADVVILSQITPGELNGVTHSLKYAEDLVKEWLFKYKFKDWNETETRKLPVSDTYKKRRASNIAKALSNHSKWRTHGKPLKAEDLEKIGLKITHIDDDCNLSDIVYRINVVCRLMFSMSNTYKLFCTEKGTLSLNAQPSAPQQNVPLTQQFPAVIDINHNCPKCNKSVVLYAKLIDNPQIDVDMLSNGKIAFPKNNIFKCDCGYESNLQGIRSDIERQFGKKVL
ncbi:MAG: ATP-dependent Clp protease proteolytic subunit [Bacilli bacterium]|nr:ATP-dependent Clp protease proteolytic subunit [Bacilli bacterium]